MYSSLIMSETIITEATFFLPWFSFMRIQNSQDNRGKGRLSL